MRMLERLLLGWTDTILHADIVGQLGARMMADLEPLKPDAPAAGNGRRTGIPVVQTVEKA